MSKTPELDKIQAVKEESQVIGEFLDYYLSKNNYVIAEWVEIDNLDMEHRYEQLVPVSLSIEKILAEYFGIDLEKAEDERQQILEELQKIANEE